MTGLARFLRVCNCEVVCGRRRRAGPTERPRGSFRSRQCLGRRLRTLLNPHLELRVCVTITVSARKCAFRARDCCRSQPSARIAHLLIVMEFVLFSEVSLCRLWTLLPASTSSLIGQIGPSSSVQHRAGNRLCIHLTLAAGVSGVSRVSRGAMRVRTEKRPRSLPRRGAEPSPALGGGDAIAQIRARLHSYVSLRLPAAFCS